MRWEKCLTRLKKVLWSKCIRELNVIFVWFKKTDLVKSFLFTKK